MKIPEKTISRLSLYYRHLHFLSQQGTYAISSRSLASMVGLKADQVRKDLSYFGAFGKTGFGYNVSELKNALARILGLEQGRRVAIIGIGNLGLALAGYKGFEMLGFKIVAAFDNSANKIGKKYRGKPCYSIDDLKTLALKAGIEMVILTVPAEAVHEVTKTIDAAGIKEILNLTPVHLSVPKSVHVTNVDLATELKSLSYFVFGQRGASRHA
jgi:redox-sensing transcriptional repressor